MDLANRGVEVQKELTDLEKEMSQLKAKSITDAQDEIDRQNELIELEAKKTQLLKEQEIIKSSTTDAQRAEASRVAGLTEAEKIKEEADKRKADATKQFEEEKAKLESLQKINQMFLEMKTFDQKNYDELIKSEKFNAMTQEEQELTLKLARDKLQLTMQKDAIIAMQQEVHDKSVALFNSAYAIQQAGVQRLSDEYKALINQINQAIQRQQQLNALRASGGFASGGFTGQGGTNEVA